MSWYGPVRQHRIRFSRKELQHILVAMGVLILAFAFLFSRAFPFGLLGGLIVAATVVPTAFLLHELGHKVVAQRYGYMAEFRAYPYGLVLALITALLGFLFAAPGAVVISGYVSQRENGRISLAGPLVNLSIGAAFASLFLFLREVVINPAILGELGALELSWGAAFINLLLGAFNMVPFPPLDGVKILRWDWRAYGLVLAALIGLLVPIYLLGPFA